MQTRNVRPDNSEITLHASGGYTVTGRDGISLMRAVYLKSSITLYRKTGLIPTRGVTISRMLKLATEITGKTYSARKRADYERAEADLQVWCDTMRTAIPTTDNRA
jgi:hypothetical protein